MSEMGDRGRKEGAHLRRRGARVLGSSIVATFLVIVTTGSVLIGIGSGSAETASTVSETCSVTEEPVESGSVLISAPMKVQFSDSDLLVVLDTITSAPSAINPGNQMGVKTTLTMDLDVVAQAMLEDKVRPAVVAAGYPGLAPTAWVELELRDVEFEVDLPSGVSPVGSPSSASDSSATSAAWTPGGVALTIDQLTADTRSPGPVSKSSLLWTMADNGDPAPRALVAEASTLTFETEVTIGLLFYGAPITGAVTAPWGCSPAVPTPLMSVEVTDSPVSSSTSPATTAPPTSSSTPSSTSSSTSTTTTWPEAPSIDPESCAVDGFDAYGGFTGMSRASTGYFRTEKIDGRWWLVDPDGHPFFSQGINHITYVGTPDRNGETPYHDAAVARYGSEENWADAQAQRMGEWGYNTVGAWSSGSLVDDKPYVLLLGMTSQNFGTGQMEDLFSPDWEAGVRATANSAAASHSGNKNLIGYWSDNELHFGPDWRELHLFDSYLSLDASAPGKQELLTLLKDRYATFSDFATDFTTIATSWNDLEPPSLVTDWTSTGGVATRTAWVALVAERYFSITSDAIEDADPNHLFFGPRMIAQTAGVPLLEAAARHVDVASFNLYPLRPELIEPLRNADPTYLPTDGALAAHAAIIDKPVVISEWSFRAADSGLPNTWPPLFPTLDNQSQRAGAYERFVDELLDTSWVVGQHWFEHADEPPAGRFDGEDSNFGLVDNNDDPYPLLTAVSRTMHDCAYHRLIAPPSPTTSDPPPTTSPATSGVSPPTTTPSAPPGPIPARPITEAPKFVG